MAAGFADVRFTASTNRTNVVPGEQVVIVAELVTNRPVNDLRAPQVPASPAFDVVKAEQNQSTSSSIQIINGRTTQSNEITYRFSYVIVPKAIGSFVFPALEALIEGTPFRTEPITFNVSGEQVTNPDIRVSLTLDKGSLYVGEQAILSFRVSQRGNSPTQIQSFDQPVAAIEKNLGSQFSLSRLFTNQVTTAAERINGEMYRTYSLRWSLIPLAGQTTTMPSVPFPYAQIIRNRRQNIDPFFDDFFRSGPQTETRTALSNQLTIRTKDLPDPPKGFSGIIGRASFSASVEPGTVPAGEAATLRIAIAAQTRPGSIADIAVPKIPGCETFAPEKSVSVDTTASGISTRKSYKYLLIPQEEGSLTIPPVTLTYFDPSTGTYKTLSSGQQSLIVTKGKGGAKQQTRYLTQEEIREVGTDIRYIKTETKLRSTSEKPYRDPLFFLLYPIPFVIVIVALLYRFQARQKQANADQYLRRRALKSARTSLGVLRKQGQTLSSAEFLSRVSETIGRFITQKFGFPAAGSTLEDLAAELLGRQTDKRVVSDLTAFIQLIDSYRFGGSRFDEKSRSSIIDKSELFLENLERSGKKASTDMSAKKAAVLLALFLFAPHSYAAPVEHWFETGNRFFSEQKYDSAVVYYEKIISSGTMTGVVYYNLGNAYFRLKKPGFARLCYEKAARLDPGDQDAAANIKFVASSIVDRVPEAQRGFLETLLWRVHVLMPLTVQLWFCFSLLLGISLLVTAAIYVSGNSRLWLIYISTLLALILLLSGLSMGVKIYDAEKRAWAIVLEPTIDAHNEPDGSKVLFTAHEGTKFQIRKSIDAWSLVSLPNGVSGWVENRYLGKI
jgi:tetratricopeptide (TPR) repeat protein